MHHKSLWICCVDDKQGAGYKSMGEGWGAGTWQQHHQHSRTDWLLPSTGPSGVCRSDKLKEKDEFQSSWEAGVSE